MTTSAILQPLFAMALLNLVMWLWMYATRIPAMSKAGITAHDATRDRLQELPPEIVRVADNYNHLFEQPTLFYAVVISIVLLGPVDSLHVGCAWTYAVLRIAHSLVQATVNIIAIRFALFSLSWLVLAFMIIRESISLFG
jgi:hypothetical protein